MTTRVTVRSGTPLDPNHPCPRTYSAELNHGSVRLFIDDRPAGRGVWCLGRIMPPPRRPGAPRVALGIPRDVLEVLERELSSAIARRAA
jgi:hypothetical protein